MQTKADELLKGAIDTHVHAYPEFNLDLYPRTDDVELIKEAEAAGLKAVVLKSHLWPTFSKTYYLQRFVQQMMVVGGITLNSIVGGFSPWAVESAAKLGARVVWMPTFSAMNDQSKGGFASTTIRKVMDGRIPGGQLTVFRPDGTGLLLPEVLGVLEVVKKYDLALSTGHLSAEESLALVRTAHDMGIKRLYVTHPLNWYTRATIEQQKEMANYAMLEHTFVVYLPMSARLDLMDVVKSIRAVGAERCILSSDAIFHWNPPQREMLRMFVSSLLELGITEDEISIMIRENPSKLLGLD
jgi:hypothetical protein